MKTGKTVEADIMQVLYNKFPYETLFGLLSLVLGFFFVQCECVLGVAVRDKNDHLPAWRQN